MDEFMKNWHFHFCILLFIMKSSSIYQLHALHPSQNSLSQDKSISMHKFSNFQKSGILVDGLGTTGGSPVQPVLRRVYLPTAPGAVPASRSFRVTGSTGDTPVQPVWRGPYEVGWGGGGTESIDSIFFPPAPHSHTTAAAAPGLHRALNRCSRLRP